MYKLLFFVLLAAAVDQARSEDRIVNGDAVNSMTTAPWQVSLQTSYHFCGGSLISNTHVMTAAHCYQRFGVTVHFGSVNNQNSPFVFDVSTFTRHPSYSTGITTDYDYAVIKMAQAATTSSTVMPIALPDNTDYTGQTAQITGWGLTSGSSNTAPIILQVANVPIVSQSACKSAWGNLRITDQMICAGGQGTSACMGDSGGPLAIKDNSGKWVLLGNTSWGSSSCTVNTVSVWSRNSAQLSWINAQMST